MDDGPCAEVVFVLLLSQLEPPGRKGPPPLTTETKGHHLLFADVGIRFRRLAVQKLCVPARDANAEISSASTAASCRSGRDSGRRDLFPSLKGQGRELFDLAVEAQVVAPVAT